MLSPLDWTLAVAVTFCAATVQGTVGFGLGVVSIPILTIVDPSLTPIPQLMVSFPLALATAWRERDEIHTNGLGLMTIARIPGALLGAWILTQVSERTLGIVIGSIVLAAVVTIGAGWSVPINRSTLAAAGLTAGFTGTSAGIGGPPLALLYRSAGTEAARSTVAIAIAIGIAVNLTVLHVAGAVVGRDYTVAGVLFVPMALGFAVSTPLRRRIDDRTFRSLVLVLATVASLVLIGRNVLS